MGTAVDGAEGRGTKHQNLVESTFDGLAECKRLIELEASRRAGLLYGLSSSQTEERDAVAEYYKWNRWFLPILFKSRVARLKQVADLAIARRSELQSQWNSPRLHIEIELPDVSLKAAYERFIDAFSELCKASRIWSARQQAVAHRRVEIDRRPVQFSLGSCPHMESARSVPHLTGAGGGELFLYPAFVLKTQGKSDVSLFEYREVGVRLSSRRFLEHEGLLPDAHFLFNSWTHANQDGSRDMRYKDNSQIPLVEYGTLNISAEEGLNADYMVSSLSRAEAFAKAWDAYVSALSEAQGSPGAR